jgi:hypothetical protein
LVQDVKRVIFEPQKKSLFLDISFANTNTLVLSLYQCFEIRNIEAYDCSLSHFARPLQLLRHQRNLCHPVVNRFTRQTLPTIHLTHSFLNVLCIELFFPQKKTHNKIVIFGITHSNTVAICTTETSL